MDQYPDENEEFELQYQDELELLDEQPPEDEIVNFLPTSTQLSQKLQPFQSPLGPLNSPQLSLSSNNSHYDGNTTPVNRRLFGTPKGPQRMSSTPLAATKQKMSPISEAFEPNTSLEDIPSTSKGIASVVPIPTAAVELQRMDIRSKRCLERDLFGDIDDLYDDPAAKKARTEEQRDLDDIEKILSLRKQLQESQQVVLKDNLARLKALHEFKLANLSATMPKWPCLPLCRNNGERIYVRFHSRDFETRAIDHVKAVTNYGSVLGDQKTQVWNEANEIILKRTNSASSQSTPAPQGSVVAETESIVASNDERLWVEKYKPRKYIDLLSDETTNRSLLYWLKMWDKVVFGRAFKPNKPEVASQQLSNFNKRTGKFESNGGWQQRKLRQQLNTEVDAMGRPMQKVALLYGPPGLGKTTLAHTLARHAGYVPVEINASDDRSPEAFKLALENGTQMSSVLNNDGRPNCIILDEIDGAPRQSIEFLVKFVSDNVVEKRRGKGSKPHHNALKRPVICICNDAYDPALRTLRQIAFIVKVPLIDTSRLTERLEQIARQEHLKTDFGALFALAEKSGNDVRSCISTMQFFGAQKKPLTLLDVLNNNMGQKDRHQGLFDIWTAIFSIQRPKKQLDRSRAPDDKAQVVMSDMSDATRVEWVLQVVHSGNEYERLVQGVYENFLHQKMPDPNLNGVVEALQWFEFSDVIQCQINQTQNYVLYPYLQYGFAVWHLQFASLAWPKINFPTRGYEFMQKSNNQKNIFASFRKGIAGNAVGIGQGSVLLTELVPLLKPILSPQLRSVAVQLLSPKEQHDLRHTVSVMVDLGIAFTHVKGQDGSLQLQMEPDLDALMQFPDFQGITLSYFTKQLLAREVELERVRRAAPKSKDEEASKRSRSNGKSTKLPNHLQRLQPKKLDKNAKLRAAKEMVTKDFFGRIQTKTVGVVTAEAKTDSIVKSPIWYRFKEGVNRAVRKDVHMHELL